MKWFRKNQRGDTIVEVLLAITVLSVVLAISYSLASRAFRTLQISKDQIQAVLILQEQGEGYRAIRDELSFADFRTEVESGGAASRVVTRDSGGTILWDVEPASGPYPPYPLYRVSSEVVFSDADSDGAADTATITTSVDWERIGGGNDRQVLVTKLRDLKVAALPPPPPAPPPPTEICGNGLDDDGDGQINEGCPVQFTNFGGPYGMGVGWSTIGDLGTQRLVSQLYVSVGCNDGETASFRATFDDGTSVILNAGCNSSHPITPRVTRRIRLTMLSGGGSDSFISFGCCGSGGWGASWQ